MSHAHNDSLLKSSLSSVSSLVALQVFTRLFTFILNQALLRIASPRSFGTAAIQFEFLLNTILFLSREGVRNTLLRAWPKATAQHGDTSGWRRKSRVQEKFTNLALLPLIIGLPLTIVTTYAYGWISGQETRSQPHFFAAMWVYALAAFTELLSEPMHNLAMTELRTDIRVRAEGLGITTKTILTFLVLWYDSIQALDGELSLLAFAAGQLAYSVILFVTYTAYYGFDDLVLKPINLPQAKKGVHKALYFDPAMLRLSMTMNSQSLVKHLLTEGDKLILSWFSPLEDQGGYAVAANYGSLVARLVFQPVEEASRIFFSKILSATTVTQNLDSSGKQERNHEALRLSAQTLTSLLSIQISLSAIVLVFGTAYLPIILPLLLPQRYMTTSAPQVLAAWVWYLPVLAINGGLEAFVSSVATPQDLINQSRWMTLFSFVYISSAAILYALHIGDTSLVYANIINLSTRIAYAVIFISSFFHSHRSSHLLHWRMLLPDTRLITTLLISKALITYNVGRLEVMNVTNKATGHVSLTAAPIVLHVALGGVLGVMCLLTWWMCAGRFLGIRGYIKSN